MMLERALGVVVSLALALAVLNMPLSKVALIVVGIVVLTVVIIKPRLGLYGFAFLSAFLPYSTITLGIRITISEALLLLVWFAVILDTLSPRLNWTLTRTQKAALAMGVFSIVPFIWGQIYVEAPGSGVVGWGRWLLNLSTLLLVTLLITNRSQLYTLITCLVAGSVLMVLISMSYFVQGFDARNFASFLDLVRYGNAEAYMDIFASFNQRMGSPWVHPNLLGGVLALLLPVIYGWWLSNRTSRFNYLLLASTIVVMLGLLMSVSRGAMLSILLILMWLTFQRTPHAKSMLVAAIMVGVMAALFYPPIQERIFSSANTLSESDSLRIDEYRAFPAAVMTYPLGIGFKTDPPPPGSELLGISNLWLNYVYKIGVVGMLLFLLVLRSWWKEVAPSEYSHEETDNFFLHQGVVAGILAALLTGLVDHYFSFTYVLCGIFWMLIGISLLTAKFLHVEQTSAVGVKE